MTEPMRSVQGSTPVPDPTELTTKALLREIAALREIFDAKLEGHVTAIRVRFESMDKAIELLQPVADRQTLVIDARIGNLRTLHDEKFHSIEKQFQERDVRTEQSAIGTKVAVDAALQAAKEAGAKQQEASDKAIAKTEANTTKQIDQQSVLIATGTKALDDKISDLKERLTLIEGASKGMSQGWGILLGAIGGIVGLIGIVAYVAKP